MAAARITRLGRRPGGAVPSSVCAARPSLPFTWALSGPSGAAVISAGTSKRSCTFQSTSSAGGSGKTGRLGADQGRRYYSSPPDRLQETPSQGAERAGQSVSRTANHSADGTTAAPESAEQIPTAPNEEITSAQTPSAQIPWYLQHQAQSFLSTQSSSSHSADALPDIPIPSNAPSCLSPLVHQLTHIHGLLDPVLLDLRHITSPPPALGPNLLMVIATTHSERHLHIAADKICRWLRTEWKLDPRADGLLGRNELKVRRKRHARKMRALAMTSLPQGGGAAGGSDDLTDWRGRPVRGHGHGLPDDGFSTGWVCVTLSVRGDGFGAVTAGAARDSAGSVADVGDAETTFDRTTGAPSAENGGEIGETLEVAKSAEAQEHVTDRLTGFWDEDPGTVTIVLQLMTASVRTRLDLESLWTGRSDEARAWMERLGTPGANADVDGKGVGKLAVT